MMTNSRMRSRPRQGPALVLLLALAHVLQAQPAAAEDRFDGEDFARGKWDASRWTPVRLPHQERLRLFEQRDGSIGTGPFPAAVAQRQADNVLLIVDTGVTEGEFEVTFTIGPEHGTAPGIVLSPVLKEGVLDTAVGVFVASYTMAVWRCTTDEEANKTRYAHLARLNRWSEPGRKHVLRCRFDKRSIALKLDDSDTLMLRDVGVPLNGRIGVWGCHGTCDFHSIRMIAQPTLQWAARPPDAAPR